MKEIYTIIRNTLLEDGSDFDGTWEIMGIFSSKEKALECCLGSFDSVFGPIPFDVLLPEERGVILEDGSFPSTAWPNLPDEYRSRIKDNP